MFGWIGKLFGTGDASAKMIDSISNGIDKLWYTEEEKSEDRAAAKREGNTVYMEWLRSTSGSRLARRYIAILVTTTWTLQYILALILGCSVPWIDTPSTVEAINATIDSLKENGSQMDAAAMIVLGFYFLGNNADSLIEAAVGKFTGKKVDK